MTAAQGYRRRRSNLGPLMIVLVIVVAAGGVFATLYAMGEIQLSFLSAKPADDGNQLPDTRGLIAVPVSAVKIPAYTKVDVMHLWDKTLGGIKTQLVPPSKMRDDIITDLKLIQGRVLATDMPPGRIFTEAAFLPEGTRDGLTGGIPPGKRALTLEVTGIRGFHGLKIGDRFDLSSASKIDADAEDLVDKLDFEGPMKGQIEMQAATAPKRARVRFLVQNGAVVMPIHKRQEQYTDSGALYSSRTKEKDIEEIVIAVNPEEVAPLLEAQAVGAQITCIPRSGHPDDDIDSVTPDLHPDVLGYGQDGTAAADGGASKAAGANGGRGSVLDALRTVEVIRGEKGNSTRKNLAVQAADDKK